MNIQEALDILGLKPNSTPEEIQRAWRRKAAELHPDRYTGEEKVAQTIKLTKINAAWSLLKKQQTPFNDISPKRVEIGVFYHKNEPFVAEALAKIQRRDTQHVKRAWWIGFLKGFWRGRIPKRSKPLMVVLCSAVVQEGTTLSFLFEAPLPPGRAAVLVPTVKPGNPSVRVYAENPLAIAKDHLSEAQQNLFTQQEMRAMNIERVCFVFPSRILDITKTIRLLPHNSINRLYYSL